VEGPPPFDTKVAPPRADERQEGYAWLPYGNAEEGSADPTTHRYGTSIGRTSGGHV
jgi:hypothetical protein